MDYLDKKYSSVILKMQKNCLDCIYYNSTVQCCDYLERVGNRRPCKPGYECTVKEEGRVTSNKVKPMTIKKVKYEEVEKYEIDRNRRRQT